MKSMHEIVPHKLSSAIFHNKLVAVLAIEKKESVIPLVKTLYTSGIRILELTLRTPIAMESLSIIKKEFPDLILGAGTVLTIDQLVEAQNHKVDFAVAPGLDERILEKSIELNLPFFPGVMTPSEIEKAISYGCRILKFFPAGSIGGLSYLKTVNAPYAHLGLKYIPLGGLNTSNISEYISSSIVGAVGGSWLAPLDLVNAGDWSQITNNVIETLNIINNKQEVTHE